MHWRQQNFVTHIITLLSSKCYQVEVSYTTSWPAVYFQYGWSSCSRQRGSLSLELRTWVKVFLLAGLVDSLSKFCIVSQPVQTGTVAVRIYNQLHGSEAQSLTLLEILVDGTPVYMFNQHWGFIVIATFLVTTTQRGSNS